MSEFDDVVLAEEATRLLPAMVRLLKTTLVGRCDISNIPFGQLRALSHLYQHDRSTVGEVAAGLGVSLATASELLDRLVDAGWVERGVNPADRRQVLINLAPHAVELFHEVHEMRRTQIGSALSRLDPDDRPAFIRGLRALVESLEESVRAAEGASTN